MGSRVGPAVTRMRSPARSRTGVRRRSTASRMLSTSGKRPLPASPEASRSDGLTRGPGGDEDALAGQIAYRGQEALDRLEDAVHLGQASLAREPGGEPI